MSYVSISSVRGERRVKLHKAGANALFNAIDVLETIKDNLLKDSPLGVEFDHAVLSMKVAISNYHCAAETGAKKRKTDAPGQGMLFSETEPLESKNDMDVNDMDVIGTMKIASKA